MRTGDPSVTGRPARAEIVNQHQEVQVVEVAEDGSDVR